MRPDLPLALVTGAAVRLGKAIALELAQAGYGVVIHYHHSQAQAQQTESEIRALGVPAFCLPADLTRPDEIHTMFQHVASLPGILTVLVNSASIMLKGDLQATEVEGWDQTFNLNLRAAWLCVREAAPLMVKGGVVINISDAGANRAWTTYPAYCVSKAALEALTRMQAKTYAPAIRVNAVAPGLILPASGMPAEEWRRLVERLPLKTSGMPEQVGKAVLFIVENKHLTGAIIPVDGGYQLLGSS